MMCSLLSSPPPSSLLEGDRYKKRILESIPSEIVNLKGIQSEARSEGERERDFDASPFVDEYGSGVRLRL